VDLDYCNIIWSAGFWEGEGSCGMYRSKGKENASKTLRVTAAQNDTAPLEKLKEVFGGSVYTTSRACSVWSISGVTGYLFLKTILPYVVSNYKRLQITSTLDDWEEYQVHHKKRTYKGRVKKAA
jgi:hypothetical protein